MDVKIDTKEKFTVITPIGTEISANMTDELIGLLRAYQEKDIPHLVVNLSQLAAMDIESGNKLAALQQSFYEKNNSFVICSLQPGVEKMLDKAGLLEIMNVTPTESEAWDIVQMEEIERELLGDFDSES